MFSFLRFGNGVSTKRQRTRPLRPESLETRRVLAASMGLCLPHHVDVDVPAHESDHGHHGRFGRDASGHVVKPFRINGGGPAPEGLPLDPSLPAGPHSATGFAVGLGQYTGSGEFTLDSLVISETGEVTGTFHGTFVFTAANGDQLATIYGDGGTGVITGQVSEDGMSVVNVQFDAFFTPDPANSTGRFANVVGGGWQMIANADSISLKSDSPGYTAPFDYTWSGTGTLEYAKKSK